MEHRPDLGPVVGEQREGGGDSAAGAGAADRDAIDVDVQVARALGQSTQSGVGVLDRGGRGMVRPQSTSKGLTGRGRVRRHRPSPQRPGRRAACTVGHETPDRCDAGGRVDVGGIRRGRRRNPRGSTSATPLRRYRLPCAQRGRRPRRLAEASRRAADQTAGCTETDLHHRHEAHRRGAPFPHHKRRPATPPGSALSRIRATRRRCAAPPADGLERPWRTCGRLE